VARFQNPFVKISHDNLFSGFGFLLDASKFVVAVLCDSQRDDFSFFFLKKTDLIVFFNFSYDQLVVGPLCAQRTNPSRKGTIVRAVSIGVSVLVVAILFLGYFIWRKKIHPNGVYLFMLSPALSIQIFEVF